MHRLNLTPINNANYIEIQVYSKEIVPGMIYNTSLTKDEFENKLQNFMRKTGLKYSQRKYKRYIKRNIEYLHQFSSGQQDQQEKMAVSSIDLIHREIQPGLLSCHYLKNGMMNHMFPWSTTLDDINWITRAVFKLTSRLYLNFERKETSTPNQQITYHVYFNYNHSPNVDLNVINETLNKTLFTLENCR
jgi:hypothetical protein